MTNYAWGPQPDGEFNGPFNSIASALDDARANDGDEYDEPFDTVWVGECVFYTFGDLVSVDQILEDAVEGAAGEYIDHDWVPTPSKEASTELRHLLDVWAEKHDLAPEFFAVKDAKEMALK